MADVAQMVAAVVSKGKSNFVSADIPADASEFTATFQQIGWPYKGDLAFTYTMDLALDGVNFKEFCSGDVLDLPVPSRNGSPENSFRMSVGPLDGFGLLNRKLRISWDFAKPLQMSGKIEAITVTEAKARGLF